MNTQTASQRKWSQLDKACGNYIHEYAQLDPLAATDWGLPSDPTTLPDMSVEGLNQRAELDARFLADLPQISLEDKVDEVTRDALEDRLTISQLLHEGKEDFAELNNLASPLQSVTSAFSLMPTQTAEDWEAIIGRMRAVPRALEQYTQSLAYAADAGVVAARRQVEIGIKQSRNIGTLGSAGAFFEEFAKNCPPDVAARIDIEKLDSAVREASRGYLELSDWLTRNLADKAPAQDPVGRDRYEVFSALFVGARVDLDETYEWGRTELQRIVGEQKEIATSLFGAGTSVAEAYDRLNEMEQYRLHGEDALLAWLQNTGEQAIADLNGTQFDIPAPLQVLQARIAPSKEGGVWYTGPSADFARPGQMWWSIPEGDTVFHTWQEKTTVFHEGIPGHHLQIAQAIHEKDSLNLWRRLGSWNSGHGEGWALYAEQLMAELGYQDDPGDRMGMLDAQRLRAARVVLDIGVHLGKERPDGEGVWDAKYAWDFLRENVAMSDASLRFELDRYLGWPGQAPSYKIGQRLWNALREDYLAARAGTAERDQLVRDFHTRALAQGSLPMDTLRMAVLGG